MYGVAKREKEIRALFEKKLPSVKVQGFARYRGHMQVQVEHRGRSYSQTFLFNGGKMHDLNTVATLRRRLGGEP